MLHQTLNLNHFACPGVLFFLCVCGSTLYLTLSKLILVCYTNSHGPYYSCLYCLNKFQIITSWYCFVKFQDGDSGGGYMCCEKTTVAGGMCSYGWRTLLKLCIGMLFMCVPCVYLAKSLTDILTLSNISHWID